MQFTTAILQSLQCFEPSISHVSSRSIGGNAFRLDASSYAGGALINLMALMASRSTRKLGTVAQVFDFGPFKRTYITSLDHGIPLLTSSEIMELDPKPAVMAKANCPRWNQYQIKRGWILVSCSGTIGNVALIPQHWNGWSASQDSIRVVSQHELRGLVWAFLSLHIVKHLIVSSKSGSVIDHIYSEDVARLELPNIADVVAERLNQYYEDVLELRSTSKKLHDEAICLALETNSLPSLNKPSDIDGEEISETNVLSLHSRDIAPEETFRLDAHFYNPTAQLAVANIRKCRIEVKTVGEVTQNVLLGPRFKRNYVDSTHGVPFLSGKNIVQIRPTDLNYLSNLQMSNMQELLVKQSWTLITRSGTIGRTCFVWKNYEDYAASEHILRLIPDESKIDPGYIYAFLSSRYGYEQILRYRHGSVIDEITDKQIEHVLVPCPSRKEQTAIGNKIREAYEKRAEAIRLEDETQAILMKELTQAPGTRGV